jgi:hypothetical protein
VIRDVIHPLPLIRASAAIEEARNLAANAQRGAGDEARIKQLLNTAREQLRLGQALGYATKDQMKELLKTVDEIEEGTKNKGAATSIFDKIAISSRKQLNRASLLRRSESAQSDNTASAGARGFDVAAGG